MNGSYRAYRLLQHVSAGHSMFSKSRLRIIMEHIFSNSGISNVVLGEQNCSLLSFVMSFAFRKSFKKKIQSSWSNVERGILN